jgi:hypothetical protein
MIKMNLDEAMNKNYLEDYLNENMRSQSWNIIKRLISPINKSSQCYNCKIVEDCNSIYVECCCQKYKFNVRFCNKLKIDEPQLGQSIYNIDTGGYSHLNYLRDYINDPSCKKIMTCFDVKCHTSKNNNCKLEHPHILGATWQIIGIENNLVNLNIDEVQSNYNLYIVKTLKYLMCNESLNKLRHFVLMLIVCSRKQREIIFKNSDDKKLLEEAIDKVNYFYNISKTDLLKKYPLWKNNKIRFSYQSSKFCQIIEYSDKTLIESEKKENKTELYKKDKYNKIESKTYNYNQYKKTKYNSKW